MDFYGEGLFLTVLLRYSWHEINCTYVNCKLCYVSACVYTWETITTVKIMSPTQPKDSLCPFIILFSQSFLNSFPTIHKQQKSFSRISCKQNHTIHTFWGGGLWSFLLTVTILRIIHLVACINSLLICITEYYSTVWIYDNFFFLSTQLLLVDIWVVSSFLVIANKATVKIWVQVITE